MHCSSPRLSAGLMMFEASIVPSAEPAPTMVCSSSMNRMMFLERRISSMTALMRSSNWPRYLVPATIKARSRVMTRLSRSSSGHVAGGDFLGQAFDDGGLADAGLAEQHRIVLGAAAENLDHALDLVLAADDRVHLAFAGDLGQVAAEGFERGRLDLALLLGRRLFRGFAGAPASSCAAKLGSSSFRISWRVCSISTSRFFSTRAATPSPSRSRPSRMCSVPT